MKKKNMMVLLDGRPADFDFDLPKYYASDTDKNINTLIYCIEKQSELLHRQTEAIKELHEHISALYGLVYRIAPELEIIDSMTEDTEERDRLTDLYLNHREDYLEISDRYDEIVAEEKRRFEDFKLPGDYDSVRETALLRLRQERA